jgi:predicted nuclease with TOPRIM domain
MNGSKMCNFSKLIKQIDKMVTLINQLSAENLQLREKIAELEHRGFQSSQKNADEAEIHRLKKENKLLKEREKLIKNKVERLVVKLESIKE